MAQNLEEYGQNQDEMEEEIVIPEDTEEFIDELTGELISDRVSEENAGLFRRVLFEMIRDYLIVKRSKDEVHNLLKNNASFLVEDLKDVLARYDFSEEDAREGAMHMAKILEEDIELKNDLDDAEGYLHGLEIPEHSNDDRLVSFATIIFHNPRFGDVLSAMLAEEEEKLASLVPEEEREAYLKRFRELYLDFLKAKRNGDEWRTSKEESEFLIKYILKYAHEFMRHDTKRK